MTTPVELLEILEVLVEAEFKKFKWLLQQADILEGFPATPKSQLENADRLDTVDQIMDTYNQNVAKVTIKVLRRMNKHDLVQRVLSVSDTSKESLSHCLRELKLNFRKCLQHLLHSTSSCGKQMFLNGLYTELCVTDERSGQVDFELVTKQNTPELFVNEVEDFFNLALGQRQVQRTLMTRGISGSGKTVLTQKLVLDWTEDKVNNTIQFIFPISFKELNLLKNKNYSMVGLLHYFFPDTKETGIYSFEDLQILFILDGLNDCQLPLDFHNNELLNDITESATVDVLLTNLITGRLLPSARLWITTTPEADKKIPSLCVHIVTEVKGFSDQKRDEYLRRRFKNKKLASTIISHINTSGRLHSWCQVPVYCHICAIVLEDELKSSNRLHTPKTLTEMYTRFLVVLSRRATTERSGDFSSVILSLAKLAFEQLLKGNQIFYEGDLVDCGIDVQTLPSYSELFTQVFREECGPNHNKLYSFVFSTFQGFLAALHVAVSFINSGNNVLSQEPLNSQLSVEKLHQSAVRLLLQSPDRLMHQFLCFLFGLSLQTNEALLKELLKLSGRSLEDSNHDTVQYIKRQLMENPPPDKCLNLLHCLNELSVSVVDEIQHYLTSSTYNMSPAQVSALVFVLLTSESTLEEFDLKKYCRNISDEMLSSLLPVIKVSKCTVLHGCNLSFKQCQTLALVLSSNKLKELDLSDSNLQIDEIAHGMINPQCKLEILRLNGCHLNLSDYGKALCSVLHCEWTHLKELDLSNNKVQQKGVKHIFESLRNPHSKLKTLRLVACLLTWESCDAVACYLSSPYSTLTELDLSLNQIQEAGLMVLSTALKSPQCKLETLRLSVCGLTDKSCDILASVLSESSRLSRLDLSRNSLCDSGVRLLSGGMKHSRCRLAYLGLSQCHLSEKSCEELGSALSSHMSDLKELDLSNNDLKDSGVQLLCVGLQKPECRLETLRLSGCMVTERGCASLASALSSNPSHLTELDLSYNHPADTGLGLLSPGLDHPLWGLKTLCIDHGGAQRMKSGLWKYAVELTLDPNTAHRNLILSENNTKSEYVETPQPYPYHPDRFDILQQVMCSSGLTGRCYWEVEMKGSIDIAVSYHDISRRGGDTECSFGKNAKSWCCTWQNDYLYVLHNDYTVDTNQKVEDRERVAVYLDGAAGIMSLYSVCSGTLTHLYSLYSTFTEPLFPAFIVCYGQFQISICQLAEELNE